MCARMCGVGLWWCGGVERSKYLSTFLILCGIGDSFEYIDSNISWTNSVL